MGADDAAAAFHGSTKSPDWRRAEERYRLLLTTIAERVWRFDLSPPVELRGDARGLAAAMLRRARLVECNPPWVHEPADPADADAPTLWLSDVLMGTYREQLELLERFVRAGFRLVDVRTTEWDRNGHARTVFTNLVGMVERDCLKGMWGAQRPIQADEPLDRLPLRFSETIPDDVSLLDASGVILFESPSMERHLGFGARARTGDSIFEHVHPDDSAELREVIASMLLTPGATGPVLKLRARHAEGRWEPRAAVVRHLDAVPGPALLALSLLDLPPAEHPAEPEPERVRSARRDRPVATARRVVRLNDALTTISGHAQLALGHSEPGSPVARELRQVLGAVERATGVVRELLTDRVRRSSA